jgi:hypothetical protein
MPIDSDLTDIVMIIKTRAATFPLSGQVGIQTEILITSGDDFSRRVETFGATGLFEAGHVPAGIYVIDVPGYESMTVNVDKSRHVKLLPGPSVASAALIYQDNMTVLALGIGFIVLIFLLNQETVKERLKHYHRRRRSTISGSTDWGNISPRKSTPLAHSNKAIKKW